MASTSSRSCSAERVGFGGHLVELGVLHVVLAREQRLHTLDRIAMLPHFHFGVDAIARRVVRRGVRTEAIRVGLDQRRSTADARWSRARSRDLVDGEDVVAVDPHAGETETVARGDRAGSLTGWTVGVEMPHWLF